MECRVSFRSFECIDQPGGTGQVICLHTIVINIVYNPIVVMFINITSFYGEVVNEIK